MPEKKRNPTPSSERLFRDEVVEAQRTQWLGPVLLTPRRSHTLLAAFAVLTLIVLGAFLSVGEFTRKAHLNGWLVPREGLVRVFAPQSGVVTELNVREGSEVTKNAPLFVLSAERQSSLVGPTQAEITRLIAVRRQSLQNEITQQERLLSQQRSGLATRIDAIRRELDQFSAEIAIQISRAELTTASTERLRELNRLGFASVTQLQQQQELELEQRGRLRTLERTRAERQRELDTLTSEYNDLPIKAQAQLATLSRNVSSLEQDRAESEARRQIVIIAPQAGIVTAIQAELGGNANTSAPLMSIVPAGATLDAHIFAPRRAVGFVRPGQNVMLRYQSFAYQKFGHYRGTIESVSQSAVSPAELPTQLSGLSTLIGTAEPIYRIIVRLDRQSVTAYGELRPLQPGMQLEADVLLERRKLFEWMLEPLYTLTGRL